MSHFVFALTAVDYVPRADSVAGLIGGRPPEGEFWDESANYAGALRPGSTTTWLDGWTAFPES
ncbi:MAG: hypothetical protein D6717_04650 [Gammaproteobacteria bacterium]|nr:MAG: hypothetical protein D6717_04650 [Gammaproteobacteria bacterium]